MADNPRRSTDFRSLTIVNDGSAPYAGALFPRSRGLTFSDCTFTSVTNNHTNLAVPSGLRTIPLGDIDVTNEIGPYEGLGTLDRRRATGFVRRMYSAKIHGKKSKVTVALYQGDNTEKEWWAHVSTYLRLRHPNIFQIFAVASSSGIHAIVVHDDLIPFFDFLEIYRNSLILAMYIHAYTWIERYEVYKYFRHTFRRRLDPTVWIRRSTGRICVDPTPTNVRVFYYTGTFPRPQELNIMVPLNDPNSEAVIIDSMDLEQYHTLVSGYSEYVPFLSISPHAQLHLGAVVACPPGSELGGSVGIAFLTDVFPDLSRWYSNCYSKDGDIMESGWTRHNSRLIFGATIGIFISWDSGIPVPWLCQANYMFHHLKVISKYEDYGIIESINFRLEIQEPTQIPPEGYLFVCPSKDLQIGPGSYGWSNYPAYWSLDPSGAERLSTDEAAHFGFPLIVLKTSVRGRSWDASVYAGLRKFYKGKGFDPDSQDLARYLGQPLYRLSRHKGAPFSCVNHEDSDVEIESDGTSAATIKNKDKVASTPKGVPQSPSWKIIMLVKFGFILALAFGSLYDYARKLCSSRDI